MYLKQQGSVRACTRGFGKRKKKKSAAYLTEFRAIQGLVYRSLGKIETLRRFNISKRRKEIRRRGKTALKV